MRHTIISACLIAMLSGCATTAIRAADAVRVPQERILEGYAQFSTPSDQKVRVVVIRDAGMLGAAAPAAVSIDGTPVAALRTREQVELFLEPGSYIFGVEPLPRLWGSRTENSFVIAPGQTRYFRISLTSGEVFLIQPTTQAE